jgi:5-methylcytosine-specific restriction protein A
VDLDATVVEVHHIAPLADGTRTTQLQDLVTLCPNCHRTVHAVAKTLGHKDAALDLLKHCTS